MEFPQRRRSAPVNLTLNGSVRMSTPASRMAISANVTTPVDVTPYCLWLMPTTLLDMIPIRARSRA